MLFTIYLGFIVEGVEIENVGLVCPFTQMTSTKLLTRQKKINAEKRHYKETIGIKFEVQT